MQSATPTNLSLVLLGRSGTIAHGCCRCSCSALFNEWPAQALTRVDFLWDLHEAYLRGTEIGRGLRFAVSACNVSHHVSRSVFSFIE